MKLKEPDLFGCLPYKNGVRLYLTYKGSFFRYQYFKAGLFNTVLTTAKTWCSECFYPLGFESGPVSVLRLSISIIILRMPHIHKEVWAFNNAKHFHFFYFMGLTTNL